MVLKTKKARRDSGSKERALEEAVKEETTRLNAIVPVNLHRQVKIQAAKEGSSITTLVIRALNEYLSKHSKK